MTVAVQTPSDAGDFSVVLSHGGDLLGCLYVRDAYGLKPAINPQIPPLTTPPAVRDSKTRSILEVQWAQWWAALFPATISARHDPEGSRESWQLLAGFPELRQAASEIQRESSLWVSDRKREHLAIYGSNQTRRQTLVELVSARVRTYPYAFTITCLPVNGRQAWLTAANSLLVTYELYRDWEALVSVLTDTLP